MKKLLNSLLLTLTVVSPFFSTSCSNEVPKEKVDEYTAAYLKLSRENLLLQGERTWYCEFKEIIYSKDGVELLIFFDTNDSIHSQPSTCIDDVCLDDRSYLYRPVVYEDGKMEYLKSVIDFNEPSNSKYGEEKSIEFINLVNDYVEDRELTESEKYYYLLEERLDNDLTTSLTNQFRVHYNNEFLEVTWLVLPDIGEYQTYFVSDGGEDYGDFVYREYANREILTQEKTDFYLVKDDEIVLLKDAYESNKITEEDVNKVLDAYDKHEGYYAYWDSLIHFVK